jgi:hypothetical protein
VAVGLALAIIALVFTVLRVFSERTRGGLAAIRAGYRAAADISGLRYLDDRARGPTLRGRSAGVEVTFYRTELRFEPFHCATATASSACRTLVVYHRAFPHPSLATRGLPRFSTDDPRFDAKFELHAASASKLSATVRAALETLPCPELTVIERRVAILWPAERLAPTNEEIDAAKIILEALAGERRSEAYR